MVFNFPNLTSSFAAQALGFNFPNLTSSFAGKVLGFNFPNLARYVMIGPVSPHHSAQTDRRLHLVLASILLFLGLTLAAMLLYAGGNDLDPNAPGYSFTRNFFSSLGRTVAFGQSNTTSAILFFAAMLAAGLGLLLFFLTYPRFFTGQLSCRIWSLLGSGFGIASAVAFIGVAFTPADLFRPAHIQFVAWAFRLLPLAIVCYTFAILQHQLYPGRYAGIFAVFAVLLVAYVWLISAGPGFDTPQGLVIQAVGQKIIVYASLISISLQAGGARGLISKGFFDGRLSA